MLELTDIRKVRRGEEVLRGVSTTMPPGQVFCLVGPNGAGKSTLLEVAAGVLRPDSGTVSIAGRNVHTDFRAKSMVTMVFQQTMFDMMQTPLDALLFHASVLGMKNARPRIEETMSLLNVQEPGRKRLFELSGGTRRKVEVAKAFIATTPVVFLDEPTNGLDAASREAVWERIRALSGQGSLVVMVSHDIRETLELGGTVLELRGGVLRSYDRGASDLTKGPEVAHVVVSFTRWVPGVLSELRSLPGVLDARVRKSATGGPDRLVEQLRAQGAIPASGPGHLRDAVRRCGTGWERLRGWPCPTYPIPWAEV